MTPYEFSKLVEKRFSDYYLLPVVGFMGVSESDDGLFTSEGGYVCGVGSVAVGLPFSRHGVTVAVAEWYNISELSLMEFMAGWDAYRKIGEPDIGVYITCNDGVWALAGALAHQKIQNKYYGVG